MAKNAPNNRRYSCIRVVPFIYIAKRLKKMNKTTKKRYKTIRINILSVTITVRYPVKLRSKTKRKYTNKNKQNKKVAWSLLTFSVFFGYVASIPLIHASSPPELMQGGMTQSVSTTKISQDTTLKIAPSKPTSLNIPSIALSANIIETNLNADGSLEVTSDYNSAGWYKQSPTPGEVGPAVISGHVDNYQGPAVFWSISKLRQGQLINIYREDKSQIVFVIDQIEQHAQSSLPVDKIYGPTNYPGLRLITCGGIYDRTARSYTHNTVVYARFHSITIHPTQQVDIVQSLNQIQKQTKNPVL
jgi:sortase (surface protein transpeptidase)